MTKGLTIWFTGLSGAGKSTLSKQLAARLTALGSRVAVLDSDPLRQILSSDLGFTIQDRFEHQRRLIGLSHLLADQGLIVLVASISPLRAMRNVARENLDKFIEVFVDAPLRLCEERDPKGLYARARRGEIPQFTGITSPYEPPLNPDVVCCTAAESVDDSASKILSYLVDKRPEQDGLLGTLVASRRERCPTIAVDFDGVIANYDGWNGPCSLGSPREDVRKGLQNLRGLGWKIVVHSTRGPDQLAEYLNVHGIPHDEINSNSDYTTEGTKPVATVYWDDRAVVYSGNAAVDIPRILSFTTWSGRV